eukprot:6055638-Pleurochrysis_carterae.AAC.1
MAAAKQFLKHEHVVIVRKQAKRRNLHGYAQSFCLFSTLALLPNAPYLCDNDVNCIHAHLAQYGGPKISSINLRSLDATCCERRSNAGEGHDKTKGRRRFDPLSRFGTWVSYLTTLHFKIGARLCCVVPNTQPERLQVAQRWRPSPEMPGKMYDLAGRCVTNGPILQ